MELNPDQIQKLANHLANGKTAEWARANSKGFTPEQVEEYIKAATAELSRRKAEAGAGTSPPLPMFEPDYVPIEQSEKTAKGLASERDAILSRVERLLTVFQPYIESRLKPDNLKAANTYLVGHNKRPLTLRCVAIFLAIHWISVTEQEGQSPRARFLSLSRVEPESEHAELFLEPWDRKHYTALIRILTEDMGVTRQIEKPNKWSKQCGKYVMMLPSCLEEYLNGKKTSGPQD